MNAALDALATELYVVIDDLLADKPHPAPDRPDRHTNWRALRAIFAVCARQFVGSGVDIARHPARNLATTTCWR